MYKTVFYKRCPDLMYDSDRALPEQFYRYLELPFVPFVGLAIRGYFLGSIEKIEYDLDHDIFWCFVEPEDRKMKIEELCYQLEIEGNWVRLTKETIPWFWL